MRAFKLIVGLAAALVLSGCGGLNFASRDTGYERAFVSDAAFGLTAPLYPVSLPSYLYRVEEINVVVPDSLIISEANSYYPRGDIVWRGDPPGDRPAQIKAIFAEATTRGTASLQGDVPVVIDITLERFHSVTQRTRYTFGGVHSIRFTMAVRDAERGFLLEEPRSIQADLKAYGGQRAIDAERQGQTQKVRITDHLALVIGTELQADTVPEGFEYPSFGLVEAHDGTDDKL